MTPRLGRGAASALGAAAALGVGAFTYGALVERNAFQVRQEVVPVLPAGSRPITVLHISDLHMAPWQTAKQDWVASLLRFEPDLIVNTGDNLGHADGLVGVERALSVFDGIPGVFAHGSNDYYGPTFKNPLKYLGGPSGAHGPEEPDLDTPALDRFFARLGWLDLNNAARAIELRGSRLEFFGTGDAHRGWDRLGQLTSTIDEMRENVTWSQSSAGVEPVGIAVTHAPYRRVLDSFVTHGAGIIFAGHTHGGQVRVPGGPAIVTNCDVPRDQAQGLSTWHHSGRSSYLEVSAGLGTSIYAPVRFGCPPEAVVVTLVARA